MMEATALEAEECSCAEAIARVQETGEATACAVCGARLEPMGRPSHVGLRPDRRVRVASAETLAPSVAKRARVVAEGAEEVRVRRLLCELRPDASGPLGWSPLGSPTGAYGSGWVAPVRVQTTVEVPAILPGAFRAVAPRSPGAEVADRIATLHGAHPDEAAALGWLQRQGSLAEGLRPLYTKLALDLAPPVIAEAWKGLAESLRHAARAGYGRKRVEAAAALWWSESAGGTVAR